MSETENEVDRLRRMNRRWKALTLAACCSTAMVCGLWWFLSYKRITTAQMHAESALRAAEQLRQARNP
jgi:hypothetical protein